MKTICLATMLLCGACGTFPLAQSDTEGVAQVQTVSLSMKYCLHCGEIAKYAVGKETSLQSLGKRVSALHAKIFDYKQRLEASIAQMDNVRAILRLNADFQHNNNKLKRALGLYDEDDELQLSLLNGVQGKVSKSILQQLQEIDTMLSTPLHGVDEVLDN